MPLAPSSKRTLATPINTIPTGAYLGIDPGKSGGATLHRSSKKLSIKMPETVLDFWSWLKEITLDFKSPIGILAVIEKVTASPQMGTVSAFTFGKGYGSLLMALTAAGIPFEEVTPQVWQKALGITPRHKGKKVKRKGKTLRIGEEKQPQFKKRLRDFCQKLFPNLEVWTWKIGQQMTVVDSILICEYARRKHEGLLNA